MLFFPLGSQLRSHSQKRSARTILPVGSGRTRLLTWGSQDRPAWGRVCAQALTHASLSWVFTWTPTFWFLELYIVCVSLLPIFLAVGGLLASMGFWIRPLPPPYCQKKRFLFYVLELLSMITFLALLEGFFRKHLINTDSSNTRSWGQLYLSFLALSGVCLLGTDLFSKCLWGRLGAKWNDLACSKFGMCWVKSARNAQMNLFVSCLLWKSDLRWTTEWPLRWKIKLTVGHWTTDMVLSWIFLIFIVSYFLWFLFVCLCQWQGNM